MKTIIVSLVAVLSLAACGGSASDATDPGPTGSTGSTGATTGSSDVVTSCPSYSRWHMTSTLEASTCPAGINFAVGNADIVITSQGPVGPLTWTEGSDVYTASVPAGYESGCGIQASVTASSTNNGVTMTVTIGHGVNLGMGTGTTLVTLSGNAPGYPCSLTYSDTLTRE